MAKQYKYVYNAQTDDNDTESILMKDDDGNVSFIPKVVPTELSPATNKDWEEYQDWLAIPNTPIAHDGSFQ